MWGSNVEYCYDGTVQPAAGHSTQFIWTEQRNKKGQFFKWIAGSIRAKWPVRNIGAVGNIWLFRYGNIWYIWNIRCLWNFRHFGNVWNFRHIGNVWYFRHIGNVGTEWN
jgi:hypothetical protein